MDETGTSGVVRRTRPFSYFVLLSFPIGPTPVRGERFMKTMITFDRLALRLRRETHRVDGPSTANLTDDVLVLNADGRLNADDYIGPSLRLGEPSG